MCVSVCVCVCPREIERSFCADAELRSLAWNDPVVGLEAHGFMLVLNRPSQSFESTDIGRLEGWSCAHRYNRTAFPLAAAEDDGGCGNFAPAGRW